MWNSTKVKPLGVAIIPITNVRTGEQHTADFIVVPNDLNCLLGLKTVTDMRLITVNKDRFIEGITSQKISLWVILDWLNYKSIRQ